MIRPLNPKQFHSRIWGVVLVLALLLTFLCSNLYSIQYTNGPEYAAQAVARVAEVEDVPASRGLILDRNGKVLVSNEISYQVTLDMSRMGEPEERCANLLSLIQVAREEGVAWADTLPVSASAPFTYTEEHPFYTASTNEAGEPEYQMTRLGRLAVYMGWIEDPEELAEGEVPEQDAAEPEEPGLWDRLLTLVGLRKPEEPREEPREEPQPYRLPTAEELLGEMCRDLDIKGQGAVDEKAARAAGETVPTLNLGDMTQGDARAVAGVLYELYYRSRIADWPPYYFAEDVDVDFITRVKELNLRGVEIETASVRKYETEYAAHLLGYTGAITKDTWPSYQEKGGYNMNDTVGVSGAEAAFEEYLHGTPGQQALERNENGKIVSAQWLTDEETGESLAPQPGSNVFLTIDLGLQQKVEDTLAARVPGLSDTVEGAACVVEDVRTGEILASASYPTYSLPDFRKDYNSLLDDPLKPLNNRAFSGLYPPGSTFKMISAIAGLEEEIITPSTIIRDEGQYTYWPTPQPKCWIYRQYGRTHGPVNVSDAIEVSCNYFFYDVGRRVGIEKLDEYAAKFGLGQKTGVELSEAAGVVASPEFTESLGGKWYEGNVLSVAIGQESTQVTPIQLANYISTLANGGTRYTTHLLKTVKSGDFSQVSYAAEPEVAGTVEMKPENLAAVTRGMHSMTTGEGSLARVFQDVPVQVAAKTGSAQVNGQSNSNAVFVCYAPYDDPQIAISIAVEKGGSGSSLASIAAEILQYYFTAQDGQGQLPAENTLVP